MSQPLNETELGRQISQIATTIHAEMGGAGLTPPAYRSALAYALKQAGWSVESRTVPAGSYPGVKLSRPVQVDMIVDDRVIVLCRTQHDDRDEAEALSQLRITGLKLALIINFGAGSLRGAIRRVTSYEG